MVGLGIKGCDILLTGYTETPEYNSYETKYNGVTDTLNLINKTAYNGLILVQEGTIFFI